jgi:RNA polymerase sigma factor (TIGR02999 family)
MSDQAAGDVTTLLQRLAYGDGDAENLLYPLVLPELRRRAHRLISRERQGNPVQATELVNAVYLRIARATKNPDQIWHNRTHFYAVFARAMRRYLVDIARRRPKAEHVPIQGWEEVLSNPTPGPEHAIAIHELLDCLEKTHPDWVRIIEMKFFADFSNTEIADALNLPLRTMQRELLLARLWLFKHLRSRKC